MQHQQQQLLLLKKYFGTVQDTKQPLLGGHETVLKTLSCIAAKEDY